MSFTPAQFLVNGTATPVTGALANAYTVVSNTGGTTAYIGVMNGTVAPTAANGFPVPSGAVIPLGQLTGPALYAITASGTATVGVWTAYVYG